MTISLHSASVPVLVKMLGNLLNWFDRAEAHAAAKKFDPTVLLEARLAPDMLELKRQVQIACDSAKFAVARLAADPEAPKFDDTETSFDELRERVKNTIAYLQSLPADRIDGREEAPITVPRRSGPITLAGEFYLKHFAMPNFYFHVTTTYALLRHSGVELGKADFLGALG